MGTLSFLRRHSTLAVFTASLGASAVFVACSEDTTTPNEPIEAGAGGSGGSSAGGSAGKGGTGGASAGGKAGSGGTGGGAAGSGGSAGSAGGKGGSAGSTGGKGNVPDAQPDVITSNGDAATDGNVPDGI